MCLTQDTASNPVQEDIQDLFLLMRLRNAASRAFDQLGFKFYEAMLLVYIDEGRGQPKQLRDLLNIQASAVSSLIIKLIEMELVTRGYIVGDGRRVDLKLTGRGHEAVAYVKQAWAKEMAKIRQRQ